MRILVFSDLPQFVQGGADMQASRLIQAWLDQGHEVVCAGRRMVGGRVQVGPHRIVVHRSPTVQRMGRPLRALSFVVSASRILLKYRSWADVVYTRFLGESAATAAALKRLGLLKSLLVATPANVGGNGDAAYLRSVPWASRLVRLLEEECDAINLIAEDMADELRGLGFTGCNFSHIPNGIPVAPPPTRNWVGRRRLLWVGRLAHQKGLDVLIRAIALLPPEGPEFVVRMVGEGPDRAMLQDLAAELGVAQCFEWVGQQSTEAVRRELDGAHVFILPSRYEGMSNAGLEAMERCLPLLLTRCGGLDRHVDGSCAWVVQPEDPHQLAAALVDVLSHSPDALAEKGASARRLAEREFDMRVVAARYATLFQRLSEQGHAS